MAPVYADDASGQPDRKRRRLEHAAGAPSSRDSGAGTSSAPVQPVADEAGPADQDEEMPEEAAAVPPPPVPVTVSAPTTQDAGVQTSPPSLALTQEIYRLAELTMNEIQHRIIDILNWSEEHSWPREDSDRFRRLIASAESIEIANNGFVLHWTHFETTVHVMQVVFGYEEDEDYY